VCALFIANFDYNSCSVSEVGDLGGGMRDPYSINYIGISLCIFWSKMLGCLLKIVFLTWTVPWACFFQILAIFYRIQNNKFKNSSSHRHVSGRLYSNFLRQYHHNYWYHRWYHLLLRCSVFYPPNSISIVSDSMRWMFWLIDYPESFLMFQGMFYFSLTFFASLLFSAYGM
jgi:hypothetical protein